MFSTCISQDAYILPPIPVCVGPGNGKKMIELKMAKGNWNRRFFNRPIWNWGGMLKAFKGTVTHPLDTQFGSSIKDVHDFTHAEIFYRMFND